MHNPNHLRLLYEWKKNPNSNAYNNIFIFRLEGNLNDELLAKAIDSLPLYYPELQAYLDINDENSYKKRYATISNKVTLYNFSDDETKAIKYAEDILHKPFAINEPPLYRHLLIKITNNLHILGLCWFHLIDDAVSVVLLMEKMGELYNQFIKGKHPNIVIDCQPNTFDFTYSDAGIDYWRRKCERINESEIKLPRQYKSNNHKLTKRFYFSLSKPLSQQLLDFSANIQSTPFVTLAAAFMSLCYLYSEQEEITLLYSVSTRKKKDLKAVGFHVNNIPLHLNFNASLSFKDIVGLTKAEREADIPYQNTPILEIAKFLRNQPQSSRSLNFLISQFTNISFPLSLEGILAEPIPIIDNEAKNDCTLFYDYNKQLINLEIEYRTALFSQIFIEQFSESLRIFLDNALLNPDRAINRLPLMSIETYKKIVYEWNSHQELIPFFPLSELFSKQVNSTPKNIALIYHEHSLTYQKLNELIDQFACQLTKINAVKGSIIALQHHRSIESIIAILAILKIGAIYLPIDPDYPENRIAYIIADAKPTVVLTASTLKELFSKLNDRINPAALPLLTANDPCYLFYTSGTTGQPKGVLNHYAGFINRLLWMIKEYNFETSDCFLQKTSFSFDISLWEIFVPLLSGGRLAIADVDSHKDPRKLLAHIQEYNISVIHFVPTMLNAFLEFTDLTITSSLRYVICSGEALNLQTVKHFNEKFKSTQLINLYGPTEASIEATACDTHHAVQTGIVPIGYALPGVQTYILNANLEPVPLGMPGELFIGGVAVATGYFNKPELTAEKFIPNPFTRDGSKMYKTGDICRWHAPRCIEYLQRADDQIKLNGFRIEISEIEYHLLSHTSVQNCAVIFKQSGDRQELQAFIVKKNCVNENTLKEFLSWHLPAYMIPAKFNFVSVIPYNTQGKVDKKNLLSQVTDRTQFAIAKNADGIPEQLRQIWAKVLGLNLMEIHHDTHFIQAGGDSISVLRVISLINQAYGVTIPLASVLDHPKLATFHKWLSNYLTSLSPEKTRSSATSIPTELKTISVMQRKLLNATNNNIVLPYLWQGSLDKVKLSDAFKVLVARHSLLRSNFIQLNHEWFYKETHNNSLHFFEINDNNIDHHITEIQHQLQFKTFNIESDALFLLHVYSAQNKHIVLFYFNHLIVDRASIQLTINELFMLYEKQIPLAPAGNYEHFVNHEKEALRTPNTDYLLSLKSEIQKTKINILPSRDRNQISANANFYNAELKHEINNAVNYLIKTYQKTPFCILITIYMKALNQFLQESQFGIGYTLSQRLNPLFETTVGPIINYGLLFTPPENYVFTEALNYNERHIRNHYENCHLKFDHLLEESNQSFDLFFDYEAFQPHFQPHKVMISGLPIKHSDTMSRFITTRVLRKNNDYSIEVRYRKDLFSQAEINSLINHYQHLIKQEAEHVKHH